MLKFLKRVRGTNQFKEKTLETITTDDKELLKKKLVRKNKIIFVLTVFLILSGILNRYQQKQWFTIECNPHGWFMTHQACDDQYYSEFNRQENDRLNRLVYGDK